MPKASVFSQGFRYSIYSVVQVVINLYLLTIGYRHVTRDYRLSNLRLQNQGENDFFTPLVYQWLFFKMAFLEFRRRLGLNQQQLGALIGVSASMVTQWESGKKHPSYQSLKAMAQLGATLKELFDVEDVTEESGSLAPRTDNDPLANSAIAESILKRLAALEQKETGSANAG